MRKTFIETLMDGADKDPRVFLIVGDLGYSVVEPFAKKFPQRFLNAGVAEQNMSGVADIFFYSLEPAASHGF